MFTQFQCQSCLRKLGKPYDAVRETGDLVARPWFVDLSGQKHLLVVCLECGALHDVQGSFGRGLLSGFRKPYKVNSFQTASELSAAAEDETGEATAREIARKQFAIPENVIDILMKKKILSSAFKSKARADPPKDASEPHSSGVSKETSSAAPGGLSRNEACSCGSGKRYKHCHGAL